MLGAIDCKNAISTSRYQMGDGGPRWRVEEVAS